MKISVGGERAHHKLYERNLVRSELSMYRENSELLGIAYNLYPVLKITTVSSIDEIDLLALSKMMAFF